MKRLSYMEDALCLKVNAPANTRFRKEHMTRI